MSKNHHLWKILRVTWIAFWIAGLIIRIGFAPLKLTLLIDRSYCLPSQ